MLLKPVETPRIHLVVQGCILSLLEPPPDVFTVCKLVAIQEVVPPQPTQASQPSNLVAGEINEASTPLRYPPSTLDTTGSMVDTSQPFAEKLPGSLQRPRHCCRRLRQIHPFRSKGLVVSLLNGCFRQCRVCMCCILSGLARRRSSKWDPGTSRLSSGPGLGSRW